MAGEAIAVTVYGQGNVAGEVAKDGEPQRP